LSHAGLGLMRRLSNKTGLTRGLPVSLADGRLLADIACTTAGEARGVSDFPVLADQAEEFGQVASVPTAYRTLAEVARL